MEKVFITDKQGNKVLPKTHVSAVYDDEGNDLGSHLGAFEDEVRGLVDTPHQEYVTVANYASLPASGSKDTIYRVSNYDGSQSQVAADVYSEYAWDGTQYVFLCVKSAVGEVFDISAYHNNAKYADLNAALTSNTGGVPQSLQKGGMSVKFVQSSDNKYVQWKLNSTTWTTNIDYWQKCNVIDITGDTNSDLDISDEDFNILARFKDGHFKTKNFDSSKNATPSERGLMSASDKMKLDTIEEGAEINDVKTSNLSDSDLDIIDDNNNILVKFKDGHIKTKNFNSKNSRKKPVISYLAIGNSVNQDVAAYIPYLLKEFYGDDVDFEIAIAFIGSYTIKDYVEQVITNQKKIEIYSYAKNTDVWTNVNNTYYLEDILGMNEWNMISFQMYQTRTTVETHQEDVTLAPQLLSYIKSHAMQDCLFGFVTPATYTDMRGTYMTWQQTVLTNCALDFFIDYGATKELMINSGISASLMCTDGFHSNEGYPCICLSLTAIHILAILFNIKDKASNLKDRMTAAKHSTLNIPNQNGSFTTTTENNWSIGIDSAVNGFRVSCSTMNISNASIREETM